jgi:hypothetical protein
MAGARRALTPSRRSKARTDRATQRPGSFPSGQKHGLGRSDQPQARWKPCPSQAIGTRNAGAVCKSEQDLKGARTVLWYYSDTLPSY